MNIKTTLAYLIIICTALLLSLLYTHTAYTDITFSKTSGFYEEPFLLELHAPRGTTIYYTLDGSDPDENALLYTQPILIEDPTMEDNVYSMRTDVSVGFVPEEISSFGYNTPIYTAPDYPVDKCRVVKAACLDSDGNFSAIKTESYFIAQNHKTGYDGLFRISISTEPENLFDYDKGIYVLGRAYELGRLARKDQPFWFYDANYRQAGADWERDAMIQLFDPDGQLLLNQPCGIRIHGGISRAMLPKGLNLYAKDKYNGKSRFFYDLFGTDYMADTMTLNASSEDQFSNFRDYLMSNLGRDRHFATMHYLPCAVFLNGEYWGVCYLSEKYNDTYLAHHYGVDKNNVVMIKEEELAEGTEQDYELYTQMTEYITTKDMSIPENYSYACDLIDINSYIDYYAVKIYIGRHVDWPVLNEALWRTRDVTDDSYADGKWRWLSFDDNNYALGAEEIEKDAISSAQTKSPVFLSLCQNADFKKQFTITSMDLMNTTFAPDTTAPIISDYTALMEEPMRAQFKRFYGTDSSEPFLEAVAEIQEFLDCRKPYAIQHLKEHFSLTGTPAPVKITVSDPDAGSITVNTVCLTWEEDTPWKGEYFTDYPITLSANANEGYRFVRWEYQETVSEDPSIEPTFDENGISVRAVFEKIGE